MLTVEAVIDEAGNVKILQPVPFQGARRALLVVLADTINNSGAFPET